MQPLLALPPIIYLHMALFCPLAPICLPCPLFPLSGQGGGVAWADFDGDGHIDYEALKESNMVSVPAGSFRHRTSTGHGVHQALPFDPKLLDCIVRRGALGLFERSG